jgi:muramoyltetrapeptide carboxypeptidase
MGLFAIMKKPHSLVQGSVVRIVSTARKISPAEVEPSVKLLKSWGLTVQLGRNMYATENQFAGSSSHRLQDLQEALSDNHVDMVWCSRGGYGTTMLLDEVDFTAFCEKPKWVVGYSDVTSLLCHITTNFDVVSLHATMPINVSNQLSPSDLQSIDSLRSVIFGDSVSYKMNSHDLSKPGDAKGPLIGGNLSILYSILGSNSSPKTDGAILFVEDLDEYLYHIDRMMVNLKRNGLLENLSALVVGGMTDMNDNTVPFGKTVEEIVLGHVDTYGYPVYFGFDAGHLSPNLALPFGQIAEIKDNTLVVE